MPKRCPLDNPRSPHTRDEGRARRVSGRTGRTRGLQLTRAADYAVRALIHLGTLPLGRRISREDLSAAIGAPAQFVGKVLQQLAGVGLVTSHRGIGGGFSLPASALEATMLDAVTAIDGPIALNTCMAPDTPCERAALCPAHRVWHDAQHRVAEVLRAATIRALADQARAETTPRHEGRVASTMESQGTLRDRMADR